MYKTYTQEYFLGKKKPTHAHLACMTTFRESLIKKTHDKKKASEKKKQEVHNLKKHEVYI